MPKKTTAGKVQGGARTHLPARVILESNLIQRVNDTELLAALPVSLGLNPDSIFLFPALVSNGGMDAYYTHMSPKTLANFAAALQAGVAFLDSHNTGRLPVGYSYSGQLIDYADAQGRGQTGVMGMFYITRGIRFGAGHSYATTDDYIRAIESSTVRDVSVGAYGGQWLCDICGQDYWGGQCPHIVGMTYEIGGGLTVATLTIDDSELSEVSAVYDGATPGAAILKVEQRMRRGLINDDEQGAIERQLGIRLAAPFTIGTNGLSLPQARSSNMTLLVTDEDVSVGGAQAAAPQTDVTRAAATDTDTDVAVERDQPVEAADVVEVQEIDAEVDALRALAGQGAAVSRPDVLRAIRAKLSANVDQLNRQERELAELRQQVAGLEPVAEDGRTYRADLIEEAIREGTRVIGDTFPVDTYRDMLTHSTVAQIKELRDSFTNRAASLFPGGRQTTNAVGKAQDKEAKRKRTPAEAYQ